MNLRRKPFELLFLTLFAVCAIGCNSKPNSQASRIAFFKRYQNEFNAYVQGLYERDESRPKSGGRIGISRSLPKFMLDNDVKESAWNGDCVEIIFWFMAIESVPVLIYSPRGLEGVPEEYRNGGHSDGHKWAYWKFTAIDEHWFYCQWDM